MGKLIIPKNSADRKDLDSCFKIYYEASDWVTNEMLIEKMKEALGLPYQEPQAYTKKTQILAYYGFIEWEDNSNSQSRRKITDSGIRFYDALKAGNDNALFSEIINTLERLTFGRNVCGCDSDSDFEPPQIFIRCVLALGYLTYLEYGFILLELEENNGNIFDLLTLIATNRITGKKPYTSNRYSDPKVILALINWGFLQNEGKVSGNNKIIINPIVLSNYADRLQKLRIFNNFTSDVSTSGNEESDSVFGDIQNTIFFGSPGTGKSREVNNRTQGYSKTRTTFHPETDYHSFVGSYKPVMNGSNIEYKFVPQAFTKAYCEAWNNPNEPHFLIIEEINRGNCAQIFGDIFQCLDRDETGKSKYEVDCNEDLANYLKEVFKGTDIVTDKIILPNNLYIFATMNTSDQSLFPMDSAFKRRWDWEFVPINYEDANSLNIVIGDSKYNWRKFIENINPKIKKLTGSEDKQLGNRFVNPNDGNITFDQFRSKVLFYLWSEVYKDEYGTQNSIFKFDKNGESKDFQFGDLYNENAIDLVKAFLTYNGIEAV